MQWPLRLSLAVFIIGILFTIQHWPLGREAVALGAIGLALFYPFRFLRRADKKALDYVKLVLIPTWALGAAMRVYHLPYANWISGIAGIAFIAWIFMEGFSYFRVDPDAQRKRRSDRIMLLLAGMLTMMGISFKIMHWPFAGIMLILGISLVVVWVLISGIEAPEPDKGHLDDLDL